MIWPFNKKTEASGFPDAPLYDLHNHILFGLDDGARTLDESRELLKGYKELGYRGVLATPHYRHFMFDSPKPEIIEERLSSLREVGSELGLEIKAGAEIMMREDYLDSLRRGDLPGVGGTYLVEFMGQEGLVSRTFENMVFDLQVGGKTLLIAHPERHPDIQRRPELLDTFRNRGALAQVNVQSFLGRYGTKSKDASWELLELGLVDVVATDLHRPSQLPEVRLALNILRKHDEDTFIRLASTNPGHIFNEHTELVE